MKVTATIAATSLVVARVATAVDHNSRELIIGGNVVQKNNIPFVCGLRHDKGGENICGAALISKNHVITTAECAGVPNNQTILYVSCKSLNLDGQDDGEHFKVVKVQNHSMHEDGTYMYNFAVLTLDKPSTIKPVRLPNASFEVPSGTWATVYGWGNFDFNKLRNKQMRALTLPVWNNQDCSNVFTLINEAHLCAGSVMSQDTCEFDGGDPCVLKNPYGDGEDLLIAVADFSMTCGQWEMVPSLFDRLSTVIDWINGIICADGQCSY